MTQRFDRERRSMPRYQLDAEVSIRDHSARTIDLSGNGMLVETKNAFAAGDHVAIEFPLSQVYPAARVTCMARVVRVEPRGDRFAVAVAYEPVAFNVATA
jgi:hypothetical protein